MNNKEGKTFADLFSSSKSEEKPEKQTVNNIFKSENDEIAQNNELKVEESVKSNNVITFDNIFDSLSAKEEQSKKEVNIFEKAIIKENKDTEQPKKEQEINKSKDINETSEIIDSNSSMQKKDNPFFKEESSISKETENINPFFENEEKVAEEIIEKKDNIFFENIEEDSNKLDSKEKGIIETNTTNQDINNPFFKEEYSISKEVENINPFFGKEENTIDEDGEKNNKISSGKSEETSIMPIIDIKLKDDVIENKNEDISNDLIEETTIKKESTKKEENSKPEISKSNSPFFDEEQKENSNNPFFQGQLNLVENKEHDKPISNIDISKSKHYDVKIVKKKEPLIKFIIGVFSYAIFIFLLLIGVTLLVYVLDTKIRAAKGDYSAPTFNAYVVLTGSMLPEIEVNDVVITKKVDAKDLKERDVITFASADSRFQGTIITHRIIKKNPPDGKNGYTFQTRGDNNNVADSALVPEANIFGKVILKIPKLGYLQEFLASDGGWIIVILIPCLVVISYDIVKLIKGLKRKKYKNIKVQK